MKAITAANGATSTKNVDFIIIPYWGMKSGFDSYGLLT